MFRLFVETPAFFSSVVFIGVMMQAKFLVSQEPAVFVLYRSY